MPEENSDGVLYAVAGCPREPTGAGNPAAARLVRRVLWPADKGKCADEPTDAGARRRRRYGAGGAGGAELTAGASTGNPGSVFILGGGMHDMQAS